MGKRIDIFNRISLEFWQVTQGGELYTIWLTLEHASRPHILLLYQVREYFTCDAITYENISAGLIIIHRKHFIKLRIIGSYSWSFDPFTPFTNHPRLVQLIPRQVFTVAKVSNLFSGCIWPFFFFLTSEVSSVSRQDAEQGDQTLPK